MKGLTISIADTPASLAFGRVVDLANKLKNEKQYLQDEIRSAHDFEEIIGESSALTRVLQQARTVARTGSTVSVRNFLEVILSSM